MSKVVKQYRFYGDKDQKNQPLDDATRNRYTKQKFKSGAAFFSDSALGSIIQLGIQSLPGVKFYINDSPEPITIGSTGIYELDLKGLAEITQLAFDGASVDLINASSGYIIVDAIYEAAEEE